MISPYLGEKDIHGSYRLSIVVQTHVECFDLFGIVGQDNRFLELLFNEVTLVFALEIKTVSTYRILKLPFFYWVSNS